MIGQNYLLNCFIADALQMLNLVKEVPCDCTSNDYVTELHFSYIFKTYIISHNLFGYVNTYTFIICTRE